MDDDYGGYYAEDSEMIGAQDDSNDQYYPPSAMFQGAGQKTNIQ
jgi:S-formylglutathione hydrolase FrmB